MNQLSIKNLSKTYSNGVKAINSISLEIGNGIFGLLGPNGAGKSSLMKTIVGLQAADSGSITFNGEDASTNTDAIKKHLGFLPQDFGVYPKVSAHDLLNHLAILKGVTNAAERKDQVLASIASADIAGQRGALTAAQKRVDYARGIVATERTLWEERITARQDLLKAEQELIEAEVARDTVRQQLQALGAAGSGGSNLLAIRAPFDGIIVEKHITLGEVVGADTRVFTLTDLSTVWADVVVPARDLDIVRVGTTAVIRSIASDTTAPGKVSFVSSLVGEASRSAKARVVLANPGAAWRPGLAVNVDIVTGSSDVPVAVAREAIQTVDTRQVVYKRVKEGFIAQPVSTGRADGRFIEITAGLNPGDTYAASGSFTIKAEQGKGEASHEH